MQRSYERRRWLRDGGRGGAGLSRRGACCCGVSIVKKLILFFWAPRAGKESSRRAAAFFSFAAPRPSRGRKHASPPSHCAAIPRRKQTRDARTRGFCDGLAARRPMPGGFFFSLFFYKGGAGPLMNAAEQGKRERAASLYRPGQSFARLYARYHRAAKTVGRLCASEHRWPGMGRVRVQWDGADRHHRSGQDERIATDISRFR